MVRLYEETAFRAAYLVLNDPAEAEDVAQEAFIKAYHALGRFKQGSPFRPWLVRIVTNEARNARKATQRRGMLARRYAQGWYEKGTPPGPESAALDEERRRLVMEAMGQLGDQDQMVLHLRYFLELSEAEMVEVLECRPGTVKSRLSRASQRLKAIISEHYSDLIAPVQDSSEG